MILAATNYGLWAPPLYSVHGGQIDQLIDFIHGFMFLLFAPWAVFFVYCLVRFRRKVSARGAYVPIKAKVSKYAEVLVACIELVLLVGFSMPVWAHYKNDPPAPENREEIHVIAEQFQWDFHYAGKDGKFGSRDAKLISAGNPIGLVESDPAGADDIVLINEFHLPVGKDIYLRLTSKDVIHSFDIPTMRVKQDVIPGMEIPIWFKVQEAATTDSVRAAMTKTYALDGLQWYRIRHHVAAEDVKAPNGEVMLAKGGDFGAELKDGDEILARLRKAGVRDVVLQPRYPMEVICAQLCGNSHFKMKAQIITHTQTDYQAWQEKAGKKATLEQEF